MRPALGVIVIAYLFSINLIAGICDNINQVPICHRGAGAHPHDKSVSICIDFGGLWGHIAQHPEDYVGECTVDIEENLHVWACNAGLRHPDHNDQKCFDMNNGGISVPNCDGLNNCLCSGEDLPQVLNSFDYFNFQKAPYFQGNQLQAYSSSTLKAGRSSFIQASSDQGSDILNPDTGVTFSLGSERFGSNYFVDLCYEVLDERLVSEPMDLKVSMTLKTNAFNSGDGYTQSSQLTHRSGVFCDYNDIGSAFDFSNVPTFSTPLLPYNGAPSSFNTIITGAKSCFARLLFNEEQNDLLRPWDLKNITVDATINVAPVNPLPPLDEGLTFCNVRQVRGNQYECFQQSFPDTASLRVYMTSQYNNIPDWRQAHNKDYRGLCRSECRPLTGAEANP